MCEQLMCESVASLAIGIYVKALLYIILQGDCMSNKKPEYIATVPHTSKGRRFIEDLKQYMNTDTYTIKTRFYGKRRGKKMNTVKADATAINVYLQKKAEPVLFSINQMRTVGNPDYNQYSAITEPEDFVATSLKQLRDKVERWKNLCAVGSGNWQNPIVYVNGIAVAQMSYNMRLWQLNSKSMEVKDHEVGV